MYACTHMYKEKEKDTWRGKTPGHLLCQRLAQLISFYVITMPTMSF